MKKYNEISVVDGPRRNLSVSREVVGKEKKRMGQRSKPTDEFTVYYHSRMKQIKNLS